MGGGHCTDDTLLLLDECVMKEGLGGRRVSSIVSSEMEGDIADARRAEPSF